MAKRINSIDELTTKANEMFEGVEILEEDFEERFDNHIKIDKPPELNSNKDYYLSVAEACNRYDPCPICYKCRNKASHLYEKCSNCVIPICVHTNANREMLIKRDNFKLAIGEDLCNILKERAKQICK